MPSGKRARQQRQQAQTPPPVRSKGGAGGLGARQASPRTLAIGGGVIVVIIVAVVLAIVLSGGSSSPSLASGVPQSGDSSWTGAMQGAAYVKDLFKGIPEHGLMLGDPNAPATLTAYVDLQCPLCQQYETEQFPTIVKDFVRTNKLNVVLKPWEILDRPGLPTDSARGQAATDALSLQNKAFEYAELLYLNQGAEDSGWLTDQVVQIAAASIDGVNVPQVVSDTSGTNVKSLVSSVTGSANALGLNATPTLLLNKRGEKPKIISVGVPNLQQLQAELTAATK